LAPEKGNQEMRRERQNCVREGHRATGASSMPQNLAFGSQLWEAAKGNAERNKSVRLILLSALYWSCFCFLLPLFHPSFWMEAKFSLTGMTPLIRNSEWCSAPQVLAKTLKSTKHSDERISDFYNVVASLFSIYVIPFKSCYCK
jgi:hypothetical protein